MLSKRNFSIVFLHPSKVRALPLVVVGRRLVATIKPVFPSLFWYTYLYPRSWCPRVVLVYKYSFITYLNWGDPPFTQTLNISPSIRNSTLQGWGEWLMDGGGTCLPINCITVNVGKGTRQANRHGRKDHISTHVTHCASIIDFSNVVQGRHKTTRSEIVVCG